MSLHKAGAHIRAFGPEMSATWGSSPWKVDIDDLCQARAYAAQLRNSELYVERRRSLLYHYLDGEFSTSQATDLLNVYYPQLPTKRFAQKYLKQVFNQYGPAVARTFGEKGDPMDKAFRVIYADGQYDATLSKVVQSAGLSQAVAVRPRWVPSKRRFGLTYILSDCYRVEIDADDPEHVVRMAYPVTEIVGGRKVVRIEEWTPEVMRRIDPVGWRVLSTEPNKYGRVPFVFMRLNPESTFYGVGDWDLVEMTLRANRIGFITDLLAGSVYPVWTALNYGLQPSEVMPRPGRVLVKDGVHERGEGGEAWPVLETTTPDAPIGDLADLREQYEKGELRDHGIPASLLSESPGNLPSGISRMIERMELIETRESVYEALREFERDLFELTHLIAQRDSGGLYSVSGDPMSVDFSVDYQNERIISDPKDEFPHDTERGRAGLLPLASYVRKWGEVDAELSDEAAVEMVQKNRRLFDAAFRDASTDSGDGRGNEPADDPAATEEPAGQTAAGDTGDAGGDGSDGGGDPGAAAADGGTEE